MDYQIAQERMYELRARLDRINKIISTADEELRQIIETRRKLLQKFPTLSLKVRPEKV